MTKAELIRFLLAEVEKAGSQAKLARRLGINKSYLCRVLKGQEAPGKAILEPLGIQEVTDYQLKPRKADPRA